MPGLFLDRTDRVRVLIRGPDRAKFLHNLTTQDVRGIGPGSGREAFVTTPQGKTLAYVTIHATEDALLLRSDPGAFESLGPHLARYGVFDEVSSENIQVNSFEWHLEGHDSRSFLSGLGIDAPPLDQLGITPIEGPGSSAWLIREAPYGREGWTLIGDRTAEGPWFLRRDALLDGHDLSVPTDEEAEALRIIAGIPCSGRDVTPSNLPQEIGRDREAISFTKGCYLGQETVARLDALGHVNKLLRGLLIDGDDRPSPGTVLRHQGAVIGTITTTGRLRHGPIVGLGFVRIAQSAAGTRLIVGDEPNPVGATVSDLPMKSD